MTESSKLYQTPQPSHNADGDPSSQALSFFNFDHQNHLQLVTVAFWPSCVNHPGQHTAAGDQQHGAFWGGVVMTEVVSGLGDD
jgi:hypothetical protein